MALFVYGLEIHVKYKFIGPEKAIIWMKTQVNKKVSVRFIEIPLYNKISQSRLNNSGCPILPCRISV